jgi:hypothetical protein
VRERARENKNNTTKSGSKCVMVLDQRTCITALLPFASASAPPHSQATPVLSCHVSYIHRTARVAWKRSGAVAQANGNREVSSGVSESLGQLGSTWSSNDVHTGPQVSPQSTPRKQFLGSSIFENDL